MDSEATIWMYWETKAGCVKPAYIDLCFDTVVKNKGNWDVVLVDEKTISNYLSSKEVELGFKINELAHRADFFRTRLLKQSKYNLWLDSDMLICRDLSFVLEQLKEGYKEIGFGSTKNKPRLPFFACSRDSIILDRWISKQDNIVDKKKRFKWTEIGTDIIWNLHKDCYKDYKQLPLKEVLPFEYLSWKTLFKNGDEESYLKKKPICFSLFNKKVEQKYKNLPKEELLKEEFLVSKLFKKVLL